MPLAKNGPHHGQKHADNTAADGFERIEHGEHPWLSAAYLTRVFDTKDDVQRYGGLFTKVSVRKPIELAEHRGGPPNAPNPVGAGLLRWRWHTNK